MHKNPDIAGHRGLQGKQPSQPGTNLVIGQQRNTVPTRRQGGNTAQGIASQAIIHGNHFFNLAISCQILDPTFGTGGIMRRPTTG